MITLQKGDIVNGNTVTDVIDHIVYFRCGKCGNPFEHGKARLRHRIMAGCFREHRSGAR